MCKNYVSYKRLLKTQALNIFLSFIATLSLIGAAFIILVSPPVIGYEISIYSAYPNLFWALLIIALSSGFIILIDNSLNKINALWKIGFLIIFISNLVLLFLPILRGYLTYGRGDVLTHIGFIKNILISGHFTLNDEIEAIYPSLHIIYSDLSLITTLSPEFLAMLFPGLFTLFYIVSIFIMARTIVCKKAALLIFSFGSLLLFKHENLMLAPSVLCFYMLPIILFLFFKLQKARNIRSHIVSIIVILATIPFLHPGEGSLFLIIVLLCFGTSTWFLNRTKYSVAQSKDLTFFLQKPTYYFLGSLFLFSIWFIWFSYSSTFAGNMNYVWNWLINQIGTTTAIKYANIIQTANIPLADFIELLLKMWGHVIIYSLSSLILCFMVIKHYFHKTAPVSLLCFSSLFFIFGILLFITFFGNIWLGFSRELRYLLFASSILNGLGFFYLSKKHRNLSRLLCITVIISVTFIVMFNAFPSPIVRDCNYQVSSMEVSGMSWFLTNRNNALLIDHFSTNQKRFSDAIFGTQSLSNIREDANPPAHFGYIEHGTYGASYLLDRYYIDSKLTRLYYPTIFPEYSHLWNFTMTDFIKLDNYDVSVNKPFSNGEFRVYYID